jgi:hypothetical protein
MSEKNGALFEAIDLSQLDDDVVVPVTIRGEEFELRPPRGTALVKQRNAMLAKTKVDATTSKVDLQIQSTDHILIGECLFRKGAKDPVGGEWILAQHGKVMQTLWQRMQDLGWTKLAGDAESKKPQEPATIGSE